MFFTDRNICNKYSGSNKIVLFFYNVQLYFLAAVFYFIYNNKYIFLFTLCGMLIFVLDSVKETTF